MADVPEKTTEKTPGEGFNVIRYLGEVQVELQKAEWPTRAELIRLTQVVLSLIFIVGVYVGALDAVLGFVTNKIFSIH